MIFEDHMTHAFQILGIINWNYGCEKFKTNDTFCLKKQNKTEIGLKKLDSL